MKETGSRRAQHGRCPQCANTAWVGIDRYVLARLEEPPSPRVEHDLHEALRKYYDEDVANLQDLLRVDLSAWRS